MTRYNDQWRENRTTDRVCCETKAWTRRAMCKTEEKKWKEKKRMKSKEWQRCNSNNISSGSQRKKLRLLCQISSVYRDIIIFFLSSVRFALFSSFRFIFLFFIWLLFDRLPYPSFSFSFSLCLFAAPFCMVFVCGLKSFRHNNKYSMTGWLTDAKYCVRCGTGHL